MGIVERKERDKQEMRDKIVEAATRMFLEDGYEKTSIRNIAEKIEYSPATIYLYFKDKDELFYAIHGIGFEMLLKEMETVAGIKNPIKRLREIGVIYINFALKNPEYYDLMFIIRAPMNSLKEKMGDDQCWKYGETTFTLLFQTVTECIEQKLIRTKDPLVASMYTWASVHGLVSLQIRDRYQVMELPEDEIKKLLIRSLDELIDLMKT
ncbi:MAG: TetR family transcriptional regulator [Bacteroidota bacterium]|nr:TetR family transcriptional regulator [Bacteroidota bacterium]